MQLVSPHHGIKRRSDRRAAHQEGWPICRLYARGAGHSALIASKLSGGGRLICLDQDDWALNNAKERLSGYGDKVVTVKTNFRDLEQVLKGLPFVPQKDGVPQVDGILFDLGVSSPQFDEGERGFSYNHDAPLDMRMDQSAQLSAADIVNTWSEQEIARVLFQYGEEKFSRRIARKIVERREERPVESTGELAELIKKVFLRLQEGPEDIRLSGVFRGCG